MVGQNVLVYRSTPLMLPYLPYLPYLGVENVSKLSAWPSIARAITPSLRRLDVPNEPPPSLSLGGEGQMLSWRPRSSTRALCGATDFRHVVYRNLSVCDYRVTRRTRLDETSTRCCTFTLFWVLNADLCLCATVVVDRHNPLSRCRSRTFAGVS